MTRVFPKSLSFIVMFVICGCGACSCVVSGVERFGRTMLSSGRVSLLFGGDDVLRCVVCIVFTVVGLTTFVRNMILRFLYLIFRAHKFWFLSCNCLLCFSLGHERHRLPTWGNIANAKSQLTRTGGDRFVRGGLLYIYGSQNNSSEILFIRSFCNRSQCAHL